jgi:5-carboxymethyl-2-hydroxymuconate isomerase/acylpyruvate hydrolase
MRLVTYSVGPGGPGRVGVRVGHRVLDVEMASRVKGEPLPSSMKALLAAGRGALSRVRALAKAATTEARSFSQAMLEERAIRLLPPVPDADHFYCAGEPPRRRTNESLAGQDAKVARAAGTSRLACEPQLVFVIGRQARAVTLDEAMDCVAGVTILNDLPGFAPMGPEIVTLDEIQDPFDLWMTMSVNGTERMRASTQERASTLPGMLERCSREFALEAGDLFATGTPGTQDLLLAPGDVVECSIEGIATLRTTIAASGSA